MKFAIAALLGLVSAVNIEQRIIEQLNSQTKKGGLITVNLSQAEYTSEHAKMAEEYTGLTQEDSSSLVQQMGLPSMGLAQQEPAVKIDMKNYKNMGYEGKFSFGNPSQELDVIFDTGSAWAWVFSGEECKDKCPAKNPKFFHMRSKDFKENAKGGQFFQYGKGAVLGHPAEDRGCFASNKDCIGKLNFLNVIKGKDLEALQGGGLIGLAPIPSKEKEMKDPLNNGIPGFITQLKNDKEYSEKNAPQFSIYLSRNEGMGSAMSFGGYDLAAYAKAGSKEGDVQWADIGANEAYWTINAKSSKFGATNLIAHNQMVILDNGMSLAMAPKATLMKMLITMKNQNNITCLPFPGAPVLPCKCTAADYDKLPDLEFTILKNKEGETTTISMPRQAYMKFAWQGQEEGCMMLINPWNFAGLGGKKGDEYWVLGAQFLQHYYTIYDYGEKKIGLVQSKTSQIGDKTPIKQTTEETPKKVQAEEGEQQQTAAKKIATVEEPSPRSQVKKSGRSVEVSIEIDNNSGLIVTPNSSNGVIKI